ncbi:MAG: hypothetical protein QOG83_63 [Alphaproteobacteria bacterium]|nr:hypothetical protein [Alphaproteobacteria bacterium]
MTTRLYSICHATPLMVIQHLRRHLRLPAAREFLLWHPLGLVPAMDSFMRQTIADAGFADTLDIRDFESLKPRTHGAATWLLESARRLRKDAITVRRWMKRNRISEDDVELWTEDPIHFNTLFAKALLPNARHVKFPHCFYLEDADTINYMARLEAPWINASWPKKILYWPWLRMVSGVDLAHRCVFDRGYTFDQPSAWTKSSIDVSNLISIDAFRDTFETLPRVLREEVESQLLPIRAGRKPLVLLLLFALGPEIRQHYQNCISRILAEHADELESCTFAVKAHPSTQGREEELFFDWLNVKMPGRVFPIRSGLNLEFLLPELRPDYVWAGPCGALPIVRRLKTGRPIALREITDCFVKGYPTERAAYDVILRDIEVW